MWMINVIPDAAILIDRDRNIISAHLLKQPTFFTTVTQLEGASLDTLIPKHSRTAYEQHVE